VPCSKPATSVTAASARTSRTERAPENDAARLA
jgi:hypothetical protein